MKKVILETINSTNTYVLDNSSMLDDMTAVSALHQTKGKGRMDRVWDDIPGDSLLFSLLIKDKTIIEKFASLSLLSAKVVASTIESLGVRGVSIKWPNDVLINGKKVTGILMESRGMESLALGIGINLNQKEFSGSYEATSIALKLGHDLELDSFRDVLYSNLEDEIILLKNGESRYIDYVISHNYLLDKTVSFTLDNVEMTGVVVGINIDNNLLVKTATGIKTLFSGEVTFHKGQ